MSQRIDHTGSPLSTPVTSGLVEQPHIESPALETLRDAPPLMERGLDEARELAAVPERDLPEDILSLRNEETGEAVAGRTLADALERNDAADAHKAAEKLEGCAFTPQMQSLVEQAKILTSAPRPEDVCDSSASAPEQPLSEKDTSGISSEAPSVTQTQSHEAPESANSSSAVSDIASDTPTDAVEDVQVEDAPDTPVDSLPEERLRELAVPEELLTILREFKPSLLSSQNLSLEAMHEYDHTLSQLIDSELFTKDDEDSCSAVLLLRLMETQMQLGNSMASRVHLNERLADLDALVTKRDSSTEQKLDGLADLMLVYRNGVEQTRTMRQVEAGHPQSLQDAAGGEGVRTGIVGEDLDVLASALTDAIAAQLKQVQGKSSPLDDEALRVVAKLALHTGERPEALLENLRKGVSWAFSTDHRNALVKTLADVLPGHDPALSPGDAMRHVDMVFQGAYPEFSDIALDLKKQLLPGHEQDAVLQHESVVASRQLLDILLSGEGPSGKTRTDAMNRAARGVTAASARSFMLTPDKVSALTQRGDIADFQFHLAHVAVLQKRAAERGLFPVPEETLTALGDAGTWYDSLQLDKSAAAYAKELDRQLDNPDAGDQSMRELQNACRLFVQGFHGQTEVSGAGRIIRKQARLTGTSGAARREHRLYESSAEYMARLALDRHIVNITGLIRPEERFTDEHDMTLNGQAVDEAVSRHTAKLYERLLDGKSPDEARRNIQNKTERQRELLRDVQMFEAHAGTMARLARNTNEGIRLRAQLEEDEALIKSMKQNRALLHFAWPHRRSDRADTCRTVFALEKLAKKLSALPQDAPEARRESILRDIQGHLKTLKGISPFTLASSRRHREETPSLETVLGHMLPRARSLQFFESKIYVNGIPTTRAREALRRIKSTRATIARLQDGIDRSMDKLRDQFGKDNIRQLQQTVTAALYKVFAESGQALSKFSINDEQTADALQEQLRHWGLPVDRGLTRQIIKLTLASLTSADGTLRESVLRYNAENTPLEFAGRQSAEEMKANLRKEGKSRISAWSETRNFINNTLLSDERRRAEGVRTLLREASMPGSGFVYDRSRGIVIDTGAVFTPFTSPDSLVNLVNVGHPLSLRMRLMHNNSMTVCNVGNGCYQVLLKGGLAAALGATMKAGIPGTPMTLVAGGNVSGRGEKGLALTFRNQKDCETFLNAFMKPDSALHDKAGEYDPSVWLSASQIRFIEGRTISSDLSVGVMDSLFKKALGDGFAGTGSGLVSVALAGDMTRRVEHNATGETVTLSVKGRATLAASVSLGVVHGTISAGSPKTTKAGATSMDLEQRFKVVTGPQGLMPACCAETECMVGPLKKGLIHDITRWLMLPADVCSSIGNDAAFSDAFERLINDLPPTAKLVVHRDIRPEVLTQARELLTRARMSEKADVRQKALEEAHRLLASFDSYVPTRINVMNVAPADIAKNWSPGLGAFQYARRTTFSRLRSSAPLTIPLPKTD